VTVARSDVVTLRKAIDATDRLIALMQAPDFDDLGPALADRQAAIDALVDSEGMIRLGTDTAACEHLARWRRKESELILLTAARYAATSERLAQLRLEEADGEEPDPSPLPELADERGEQAKPE